MKPKLISFKLCPFVQKAVLTLLVKGVEFDIEYIDLGNPPVWFDEISPLGKVPLLLVDETIIFESSVIVEYLDEAYGKPIHPKNLLLKANHRSWMEFGNECLVNGHQILIQKDKEGFTEKQNEMLSKFDHIEKKLSDQPYFNGNRLSLVDLSFIPLFQRVGYINAIIPGLYDISRHPKLNLWADRILNEDVVGLSTVPEIKQLYTGFMKSQEGYLSSFMD